MWAYYFLPERVEACSSLPASVPLSYTQFLFVLATASLLRLYKLSELPLGPYVDEIFTLNNSLDLLNRAFDLFGHTPLFGENWVETANIYLYFNLLILKLFGVSHWSMKLLSVIPGIMTCGAVFLICHILFDRRVALWAALLFTFAHWPVRLSRYGWDVSFMIMAFSITLWLLLLAAQRGRPLYAYFSGMTAGLCLYSYLGARICLLSLVSFLTLEWALARQRRIARQTIAFVTGAATAAFPLLIYYLDKPRAFWVRIGELSVFNDDHPLTIIIENIWRHALMFFTLGGTYARDNFPGVPMMDPLSALLLVAGLAVLVKRRKTFSARLIACTLLINFTPGVFSISQEGPPYVYRTAAVMIPAFLAVGLGLQGLMDHVQSSIGERRSAKYLTPVALCLVAGVMVLNLYFYFGLEAKNGAAMRVMTYEARLIGLEIARDNIPVILVGKDTLDQTSAHPKPDEEFADANPPPPVPPVVRKLAIINFSGRYDQNRSVSDNLEHPKDIYFADPSWLESNDFSLSRPAKIIFSSRDRQLSDMVQKRFSNASLKELRNIFGEPLFEVVTLSGSPGLAADPPAAR